MPIFDYQCEKCEKVEEKIVKVADVETKTFDCECEEGAKMLKQMPNKISYAFVGPGWFNSGGY